MPKASVPLAGPSILILVAREVSALDSLAAELAMGVRGPAHYNELEEQACGIADRLRAAFRKRRPSA